MKISARHQTHAQAQRHRGMGDHAEVRRVEALSAQVVIQAVAMTAAVSLANTYCSQLCQVLKDSSWS